MRYQILLLAALVAIPCGAFASATWTNEPAGSHTFLDCPFNSLGECGLKDGYGSAVITPDATAPVSPSSVMKSKISAGANSGGAEVHYYTPQLNRELFVGLMWRNNSQFQCRTTANKMFFVRGPKMNGFFGLGCTTGDPSGNIGFGHNTGSLDNSHTCAADLGLICYPNINTIRVPHGTWTKIEVYMKSSTTATSRDGIVRWWVNGNLSGNYTNFNYAPYGLNEWVWSETWDGTVTNPVPSVEWAHFIDHLYISAPNFTLSLPTITTATISPTAQTGTRYNAYLNAANGYAPYTWSISGGNLPDGLNIGEKTGVITGTPTTCGLHSFTVKVADANGSLATKTYSLNVTGTCTGTEILNQVNMGTSDQIAIRTVSGMVALKIPLLSKGKYQVRIFDVNGKEVRANYAQSQSEIEVKLGTGVYVAKILQGSAMSMTRFYVVN